MPDHQEPKDILARLPEWESDPETAGVYVRKQSVIDADPIDWTRQPEELLREMQRLGLITPPERP